MSANRIRLLADEIQSLWLELRGDPIEHWRDRQNYLLQRKRLAHLLREYAEMLPAIPVSRCPYCHEVAHCVVDVDQITSPWWTHPELLYAEPRVCEHFVLLQGAVDIEHSNQSFPQARDVYPGPNKPFVIRNLIKHPLVRAVVGHIRLAGRFNAYPICYFVEESQDFTFGHQQWGRQSYLVRDKEGVPIMTLQSTEPWDFNMEKWAESGKLLWIEAGDSSLQLKPEFPDWFSGLAGQHKNQMIREGEVLQVPEPLGEPIDPWDSHVHD